VIVLTLKIKLLAVSIPNQLTNVKDRQHVSFASINEPDYSIGSVYIKDELGYIIYNQSTMYV